MNHVEPETQQVNHVEPESQEVNPLKYIPELNTKNETPQKNILSNIINNKKKQNVKNYRNIPFFKIRK